MSDRETSIGGGRELFPSTHWTQLLRLRDPSHPEYQYHLNQLLQNYWKPCYFYIRRCWHMSVEDAKDLTQEFYSRFLQKDYFSTITEEKGTFRAYLRSALFYFMSKARRSERARRPREGAQIIHFQADEDWCQSEPAGEEATPDQAFDRAWMDQVLRQAVVDLKMLLESMNKGIYARVFERYYGVGTPRAEVACPGYAEIATEMGLKETDVRNYLTFARSLLRKEIEGRIREYVASEEELQAEIARILGE